MLLAVRAENAARAEDRPQSEPHRRCVMIGSGVAIAVSRLVLGRQQARSRSPRLIRYRRAGKHAGNFFGACCGSMWRRAWQCAHCHRPRAPWK